MPFFLRRSECMCPTLSFCLAAVDMDEYLVLFKKAVSQVLLSLAHLAFGLGCLKCEYCDSQNALLQGMIATKNAKGMDAWNHPRRMICLELKRHQNCGSPKKNSRNDLQDFGTTAAWELAHINQYVNTYMSEVRKSIHQGLQRHSPSKPASDILSQLSPPQQSLDPSQTTSMGQSLNVGGDSQFDAMDAMDTNLDGEFLDTAGDLPPSNEEWYEGAAKCYSQDGLTFLDLFDTDEHAEYRKENLFYPFALRKEWEVADFLLHSALSMAAINKFLQLSMIRDAVWSIQDQLPQGATVLGTVLSSDKTNITMMTGARVAHPLLLGLANICMRTRMKLSSKVFMLTALLPIPQYLHPNQRMRGMLEDCLIHECLSIILQPLMKAAELGIMMSDPVGNIRHCFTPLAAYIVDTPEACMLACVHGKTSPFTLVSYLQFGDNFRHPARTREITLEQLASIDVDPNDLEGFFAACAEFRLNGVFAPFWKGWPFSDPAIFLTLEALHHWHKQSLALFHDNKDVIMTLGAQMGAKRVIDNWHIPKLELMQSITTSTCQVGALIQWSADATEHAHVSEIKDPARQELNHTRTTSNYFSKIRMLAATRHGIPQAHPPRTFLAGSTAVHLYCNPTYTGLKIDDIADQFNIPDLRHALSDFFQRDARNEDGVFEVRVPRRSLINCPLNIPFKHIQVWHTVRLQQACLHDPSIVLPAQIMHASACPGWPKGRQDVAIFNINSAYDWPESGLMGHAVCELQLIMRLIPRRGSRITCFKIGAVDPVTEMHTLTCTKHANGTLVGDIVPLTQIRAFISIILKLGAAVDPRLTKSTSA
ncbi:hypothetical protein C8R48DRAFT_679594 [Suillus tomentosus]|nr:hypothetical protein C8R48DRAFT_679594 [Suillus tomentosus]